MAEKSFAPYTFIPFTEIKAPFAYPDKEELPSSVYSQTEGVLTEYSDGSKKTVKLHSGWIDYTVEPQTPISIGREDRKNFFQDGRGRFAIPGSTMRGFFRSHAEILSFSYPEMIDDSRYLYRKIAGNCVKVRERYQKIFDINPGNNSLGGGKPPKAKAGWLYFDKGKWYIQRVKEFPGGGGRTYFAIYEDALIRAGCFDKKNQRAMAGKGYDYEPYGIWKDRFGNLLSGNSKAQVLSFDLSAKGWVVLSDNGKGSLRGGLMNSAYMYGKKHHLIVSLESDGSAPVEIDPALVEDYRRDLERTKKVNREADGSQTPFRAVSRFYMLPGIEEKKIFFYLEEPSRGSSSGSADDADENARRGTRITAIGPTQYFRIPYEYPVPEGIPMEKADGLDYANAMFGYARNKDAYRSRLSFQNAVCTLAPDAAVSVSEDKVVLNSPQGTAFHIYLDQKPDADNRTIVSYNDKGFKLRGTKTYWKRSDKLVPEATGKNMKIYTTLHSLPAKEAVFKGRVYFKNLRADELGLLLMSMRYFDEGKETYMLGGGKPYGFGKVEIKDISVHFSDPEDYLCVNPADHACPEERLAEFKKAFRARMDEYLKQYDYVYNNTPSIKVYRDIVRLEDADSELGRDANSIYMTPGTSKTQIPGYGNYYPLETAETILDRLKKTGSQPEKEDEEQDGVVWVGRYRLSDDQGKRLLKQTGRMKPANRNGSKRILDGINGFAEQYSAIALPSDADAEAKRLAQEKYKHVWVAKKSGRTDNGWSKLK